MKRLVLILALAAAGVSQAASQEFPVAGEGWRKVRVGFMARVTDERCFESNAMLRVWQSHARLPVYSVQQASSKPDAKLINRRGNFRSYIFSSAWRPYVRELWVEPEADKVTLKTPDAGVEVKDVRMKVVNDGKIAINGDFRLGPFNYSGIAGVERVGRIEEGEGGRGRLNANPLGAIITEPVPLKPDTEYRITMQWTNPGEKGMRVHNYFLGKDGKKVYDFHWYCNAKTSSCTFRTKSDVAAMNLCIYHGIVTAYSIEEVRGAALP